MKFRLLAAVLASILPMVSSAFGAENPPADEGGSALAWFILAPTFVLIIFLVMLARRSGSFNQGAYLAKAADHLTRSEEHTASMERKADRMIQLLESIDQRHNGKE